jgi:hypothetical protein
MTFYEVVRSRAETTSNPRAVIRDKPVKALYHLFAGRQTTVVAGILGGHDK